VYLLLQTIPLVVVTIKGNFYVSAHSKACDGHSADKEIHRSLIRGSKTSAHFSQLPSNTFLKSWLILDG